MLIAFAVGTRTCPSQISVPDKSDEISAMPLSLKLLGQDDISVTLEANVRR
jgi:hypothetical protein